MCYLDCAPLASFYVLLDWYFDIEIIKVSLLNSITVLSVYLYQCGVAGTFWRSHLAELSGPVFFF
jgi:hypothetical protein